MGLWGYGDRHWSLGIDMGLLGKTWAFGERRGPLWAFGERQTFALFFSLFFIIIFLVGGGRGGGGRNWTFGKDFAFGKKRNRSEKISF